MRIAIVGPAHFGIAEPFAGGLEAHTSLLAHGLDRRGHRVTVFAGHRTAHRPSTLRIEPILDEPIDFSGSVRSDNGMPPGRCTREDDAYRRLIYALANGRFDVVHNNSLHYLLPGLDHLIAAPVVHTLHTPPFPWLLDAHERRTLAEPGSAVVAVSRSLQRLWNGLAGIVIRNGVPVPTATSPKRRPDNGRRAIWVGRLVPEKAPHLAIDAASKAGFTVDLYGPAQHTDYFNDEIEPRLGSKARWHGQCNQHHIRLAMDRANVGLVTPCWDEPFGLTTAEMTAAGLPVAGFDRGATREILSPDTGRLARPGDVDHLAEIIPQAAALDRNACRIHALTHLSDDRMVGQYEDLYQSLMGNPAGRPTASAIACRPHHVTRPAQARRSRRQATPTSPDERHRVFRLPV